MLTEKSRKSNGEGDESMRILITGGAGYLGSVLTPYLVDKGHQIHCLGQTVLSLGFLNLARPMGKYYWLSLTAFQNSLLDFAGVCRINRKI